MLGLCMRVLPALNSPAGLHVHVHVHVFVTLGGKALQEKCFTQEHNTMSPSRLQNPESETTENGVRHTYMYQGSPTLNPTP